MLDNYSTDTFEGLNYWHRNALTRIGSGDINERATVNAFRSNVLDSLVPEVSREPVHKISFSSIARISQKTCMPEASLLASFESAGVLPVQRNNNFQFGVLFSSKYIRSNQFRSTDVFVQTVDRRIGRFLFAVNNSSTNILVFCEELQQTRLLSQWKCINEIFHIHSNEIADVVSLVHDCKNQGCLDRAWSEISVLVRDNANTTVFRTPSEELKRKISSCKGRLHRTHGPFYLQNFLF